MASTTNPTNSTGSAREVRRVINPHVRRTIAANLGLSRGGNGSSSSSNNDNNNNDCNDCDDCSTTNKENNNSNSNAGNANATDKESDADIVVLSVRDSNGEKVNTESKDNNMGGRGQNKKTQREKKSRPEHQEHQRAARQSRVDNAKKSTFNWPNDCRRCYHKVVLKTTEPHMPHRGHHVLCPQKPPPLDKKEKAQLKELNRPLQGDKRMCSERKFGKSFFKIILLHGLHPPSPLPLQSTLQPTEAQILRTIHCLLPKKQPPLASPQGLRHKPLIGMAQLNWR